MLEMQGKSGKHLSGVPPYGYVKDPNDKAKWIIDEEAATVVKDIYNLYVGGKGIAEIAKILTERKVDIPTVHFKKHGLPVRSRSDYSEVWNTGTILRILSQQMYTGCTVNFKTAKKSYKTKVQELLSREQWEIFDDTQEAIIDKETFAIVQKMRECKRRPRLPNRKENIFSGLLFCADCKNKMYFHSHANTDTSEGFVCASFKKRECCSTHHITLKAITQVVLNDLHRVCNSVREREQEFVQAYRDDMAKKNNRLLGAFQNELKRTESRCTEIDEIIRRLYEDNVLGRITDERFDILAKGYESEKKELKVKSGNLRDILQANAMDEENLEKFKRLVKRYTEITELNTEILNAFIDKIYVGEVIRTEIPSERKRKQFKRTREIRIIYKFVGAVNLK